MDANRISPMLLESRIIHFKNDISRMKYLCVSTKNMIPASISIIIIIAIIGAIRYVGGMYPNLTMTNKINVIGISVNFGMFIVYCCLLFVGVKTYYVYQDTIKESQRQFELSHQDRFSLWQSCIYRHGWEKQIDSIKNVPKDSFQLQYSFQNNTKYDVQIDSVKNKWSFDHDTSISFDKVDSMEIPKEQFSNMVCTKDYNPAFSIYEKDFSKKYKQLMDSKSVLFVEAYYTNTFTKKHFRYRAKARIDGTTCDIWEQFPLPFTKEVKVIEEDSQRRPK